MGSKNISVPLHATNKRQLEASLGILAKSIGIKRPKRVDRDADELLRQVLRWHGIDVSRADPVAVAVVIKTQNPEWSVRRVAEVVGVDHLKLWRNPLWKKVCEKLKQCRPEPAVRRGEKVNGFIEAEDSPNRGF